VRRLYDLVMDMDNAIYPPCVEDALLEWQEAFEDPEFLSEQKIHPYFVKQATRDVFGQVLTDIWLQTGEVHIGEELAETLIKRFIVSAVLLEMKDAGFVDSIENENGEEVFWATAKGKEYAKRM